MMPLHSGTRHLGTIITAPVRERDVCSGSGWQLLEERQDVAALQLTADDHLPGSINAVHLKDRLGDVETDCRDRLHSWLLRIVGVLTPPTSRALTCRCRSRPQHHKRTKLLAQFAAQDMPTCSS